MASSIATASFGDAWRECLHGLASIVDIESDNVDGSEVAMHA